MEWRDVQNAIRREKSKLAYCAMPYAEAILQMSGPNADYWCDSGESIILRFLGNAQTWRGETAREVKAALKRMVK